MEQIRAGFIGFGFRGYSEGKADRIVRKVRKDIETVGIKTFVADMVYELDDVAKSVRQLTNSEFDLIVACIASWISPPAVMALLREFKHIPIFLYSVGARTEGGVLTSLASGAGVQAVLEPMRAARFTFKYILEEPDSDTKIDEILTYARISQAAKKLRKTKIGLMGWGDMGLYTSSFDASVVRNRIGPEIIGFDMLEVEKEIKYIPKSDIKQAVKKLKTEWKYVNGQPSEASLNRVSEIYLALRKIVKEREFQALSIKCAEGMSLHMGCIPCIPVTLLGDKIPYACESDIPNLLSQIMLAYITNQTTAYLVTYEFFTDRVLLGVCGFVPISMIDGIKQIRIVDNGLYRGLACCSKMKTGRVTIARLFSRGEKYLMFIVTGKAETVRSWVEIGYSLPSHPGVEFIPDGGMSHLIKNLPAQHVAMVYGDHAEKMEELCNILEIEVVRAQRIE